MFEHTSNIGMPDLISFKILAILISLYLDFLIGFFCSVCVTEKVIPYAVVARGGLQIKHFLTVLYD